MIRFRTLVWLLSGLLPLSGLEAHSYVFSKEYEEMRDQVWIYVMPEQITIQYESKYYGQIAPHIRNMVDVNTDTVLTEGEVADFFADYDRALTAGLQTLPLFLDGRASVMKIADIVAPTILTDSLLAPFSITMVFQVDSLLLKRGEHELVIDPKSLFLNGTQFIKMAKERVAFTDQQHKAIGRFLQINVFASEDIEFTSTYPGYIKRDQQMVRIFGVFYDDTVLRMKVSQYPKLRIKFTRM